LRHNQLAHVTLTAAGRRSAGRAAAAVVRDGTQAFVFVQTPDRAFDRRAIQTGRADDRFVEVRPDAGGRGYAVSGTPDLWTAYSSLR